MDPAPPPSTPRRSPVRATPRFLGGLLVLHCLGLSACRTPTTEEQNAPSLAPREKAAATPAPTSGSENPVSSPAAELPAVPLPATSPDLPAQLLACGEHGFARLARDALQVFQLDPSATLVRPAARQVAHVGVGDAMNLIPLAGESRLVIGQSALYRHYRGEKAAARFARIPVLGPLFAWPDPRDIDSFWIRYLRDPDLHHYSLAKVEGAAPDAPQPVAAGGEYAVTIGQPEALPGFDQRLLTLMADGSPFYSTTQGLVRRGPDPRLSPSPAFTGATVALWADSTYYRYWAADGLGNIGVWEQSRGEPRLLTATVPGVVVATDVEAAVAAIVSVKLEAERYRAFITTFRAHEQQARWEMSSTPASDGQPTLDVCLLGDRPLVVAGGRDVIQLFDARTGEPRGEW